MARTVSEIIAIFPKEPQERIQQRSEELVQEYMALQELRKALALTQTDVAEGAGSDPNGWRAKITHFARWRLAS